METQKYSINQFSISSILSWIRDGVIAIPEIQRPFVWKASKVRDLLDSLYHGFPVGYLIAWNNPNIKLKDGSISAGKKILIDGQQRVMALKAAILGDEVIDDSYQKIKIQIAFHPMDEKFEVLNPALSKDPSWLPDVSRIINGTLVELSIIADQYCVNNPGAEKNLIFERLDIVRQITQIQLGLIELSPDLDIETVTEIFIRINSEGVVLSQADFAMSKIASSEKYGGVQLRKCIDYFCNLAISPEVFSQIVAADPEFTNTKYFKKMVWLKDEVDSLYDPTYTDMLRVAFTSEFTRGKLSDLVALLSGRNFETRSFEEEIAEESFKKLNVGIYNFMNENHFKKLLMIIKSAGFIRSNLIRSRNAINFAYILYLRMKQEKYPQGEIEKCVRRWFVMALLLARYSGSAESSIESDIKSITSSPISEVLSNIENADLSDAFWDFQLVQHLETSSVISPLWGIFLASQVKQHNPGFLSKHITVQNMIEEQGDIHHIFPRDYLKKQGMKSYQYNQIANFAYIQSEINIQIGNKPPKVYFEEVRSQMNGGKAIYGLIDNMSQLTNNLNANCVPVDVMEMEIKDYGDFLSTRRILMAKRIKDYYLSL